MVADIVCVVCNKDINPATEEHFEQEVSEGTSGTVCQECLEPSVPYSFWCDWAEDYVNPNRGDCDACEEYGDCDRRTEFRIPS